MRRVPELPTHDAWRWPEMPYVTTPYLSLPDRREATDTVLVGPDGKTPIIQRKPVPFGFRPERTR